MYPVSDLFKSFLKRPDREFLVLLDVDGESYDMANIVDFSIESNLLVDSDFTIGTVNVSKLTVRLRLKGLVSDNACIKPYIAFDSSSMTWEQAEFAWDEATMPWGGGATDWLPLGEYYVDRKERINDVWEFECLDKLIWSERPYVSALTFPASMKAVWDEICTQIGYSYDNTVQIDLSHQITFKPEGFSCRHMMGFIAGANAASVRAGKEGQIQFKRFAATDQPVMEMTAADYIRAKHANPLKTYTRFVVVYDAEQELIYAAGSGSEDQTLNYYNPFMTQTMVDRLHNVLNGFSYQPMEMDARGYPHFDVGDAIGYEVYEGSTWQGAITTWQETFVPWNGLVGYRSLILKMTLYYKGGFKMMLDAPSKSEQQSEYVVEGPLSQKVQQLNKEAVKLERNYYGVTTSREEGLVVEVESGSGRAVLNADELSFWTDGSRALWFDIPNKRYMFTGTLVGVDGTFSGTVSAATIIGSEIYGSYIEGGDVIGARIATSESYPRIEFSATADLLSAEYSANRKILIDPNNYISNPYPHLRWLSEGHEASIHLSGSAGFIIDADDVRINGELSMSFGSELWVADLSKITFGSWDDNLQKELDDKVDHWYFDSEIASLDARIRALENA